MVKIKKISKNEVRRLVEIAFTGDADLISKYHITNRGLAEAVESTVGRIMDTSKVYGYGFFKVLYEKKPIGFFVAGNGFLYSFGINIRFRTDAILKSWWALVKKQMGSQFLSMLYKKNTRAIRFLQKMGMEISNDDGIIVTLVNDIRYGTE